MIETALRRAAGTFVLAMLTVSMTLLAGGEEGSPEVAKPAADGDLWRAELEVARSAAAAAKKPVLVDFKAEWCGPCKKLERETFGDERVIKVLREHFVPVRVDVDEQPDLAKEHGVEALPTILFLAPGGDEIHRIVGFRPAETFVEELGKIIGTSSAFEEIKQAALDAPDDADAQRAYARALVAAGQDGEAVTVLEHVLDARPDDLQIHADIADLHMSAGRLAKARDHYARVASAESSEHSHAAIASTLLPLARCELGLGEEKASLTTTARYLTEFAAAGDVEKSHEARFLRGYAFARLKETKNAVAELEAVVEAAPDSPWGLRAAYILDLVALE